MQKMVGGTFCATCAAQQARSAVLATSLLRQAGTCGLACV